MVTDHVTLTDRVTDHAVANVYGDKAMLSLYLKIRCNKREHKNYVLLRRFESETTERWFGKGNPCVAVHLKSTVFHQKTPPASHCTLVGDNNQLLVLVTHSYAVFLSNG